MIISRYFICFIIYSVMGWLYESTYCTIKNGEWSNRGFLHGPLCPIYGCGAITVSILCDCLGMGSRPEWQIFLICFFGSMVLEYSTSWLLETLFHAYWWDYSEVFCNIKGRICLPASTGFGLAGLFVVHFVLPFTNGMVHHIPPVWIEFISLILMGVTAMDTALTVAALTDLAKNLEVAENEINQQISEFYDNLQENILEKKQVLEDKVSAIKETATLQKLDRLTSTMNLSQKHVLRSVQGFRLGERKNKLGERLISKLYRGKKDSHFPES